MTLDDTSNPLPSAALDSPSALYNRRPPMPNEWRVDAYHVASRKWRPRRSSRDRPEPAKTETAMTQKTIAAEPYEFTFDPGSTALLIIDMQRDFVEPGGFGEALGNDVTPLQAVIAPCKRVLDAARRAGMLVIHTREGHSPDLADCPPTKIVRGRGAIRIGDPGPMGRILVRGERGHDIVPELVSGAGRGGDRQARARARSARRISTSSCTTAGIKSLIVCGVTTEVCVNTTVREANDRGYECVVLADCVGSYFPEFQRVALEMIKAQGGIFGWVSDSKRALAAFQS